MEQLSVLSPEYLIPLKARAWLNLSAMANTADAVDEKDVRKHKNDIIRLYQLLTANTRVPLQGSIKQDMEKFLRELEKNPADLKALGLKSAKSSDIITNLSQIYGVSSKKNADAS